MSGDFGPGMGRLTDANGIITYINYREEDPVRTFCTTRYGGLTTAHVFYEGEEVAEFVGVDRADAVGQASEWLYHALKTA